MKLLVFVGPKGSGKDASAKILKDAKSIQGNVSFAGPLKRICSEVFGLHLNMFNDPVLKEKPLATPITVTVKHLKKLRDQLPAFVSPYDRHYNLNGIPVSLFENQVFKTPREVLQIIGTDLIRDHVLQDYHVLAAFGDHNMKVSGFSKTGLYAVTDCRFLSEYLYLKANHDCQFFYVERPEAEARLANATHQSELESIKVRDLLLAEGGTLIKNDGTLEELTAKVTGLVSLENNATGQIFTPKSKLKFKKS